MWHIVPLLLGHKLLEDGAVSHLIPMPALYQTHDRSLFNSKHHLLCLILADMLPIRYLFRATHIFLPIIKKAYWFYELLGILSQHPAEQFQQEEYPVFIGTTEPTRGGGAKRNAVNTRAVQHQKGTNNGEGGTAEHSQAWHSPKDQPELTQKPAPRNTKKTPSPTPTPLHQLASCLQNQELNS